MNHSQKLCSFFCVAFVVLLCSCNQPQKQKAHCEKQSSLPLKYKPHFSVDYYDGFKVVTVYGTDTANLLAQYVLLPKNKPAPVGFDKATLIETPVRSSIAVPTNHVAIYSKLGIADTLLAVANAELIYDSLVRKNLAEKKLVSVGSNEYDFELIAMLYPSFVLHSGSYDGGDKLQVKLKSMGVKTVLCADYMEQNPLARAEWIKFVATFYNMEAVADSLFQITENKYLQLKQLAASVEHKPTVFCNMPFKEIWYMPTGQNFSAQLIADAGGDFLWKDAKPNNGLNLSLDYEAVYAKAANADIWLVNSLVNSLKEMSGADTKNKEFGAFKKGKVYNHNNRTTVAGGSDYWESGVMSPDVLLADLIHIFHPELMPAHQLYYYKQLQ